MLDIFQLKRRYTTFDDKSINKLMKALLAMTTYSMDEPVQKKVEEYYYDSQANLLQENGIYLVKRVTDKDAMLKIGRIHYDKQYFYMDRIREKDRQEIIPRGDKLSDHYFFLSNALNSMFSNALKFDTDKLFEKTHTIMRMEMKQTERYMLGYGGLKMIFRYEKLSFENYATHRKNNTNLVQFKLVSGDETLPVFEEFIRRLEKYCKEIFLTKESRLELALRMTKPLPSKQDMRQFKIEMARKQALEKMGLGEIKE